MQKKNCYNNPFFAEVIIDKLNEKYVYCHYKYQGKCKMYKTLFKKKIILPFFALHIFYYITYLIKARKLLEQKRILLPVFNT